MASNASRIALGLLLVLSFAAVAGCSGMPKGQYTPTPCTENPGSYECHVYRYQNAA